MATYENAVLSAAARKLAAFSQEEPSGCHVWQRAISNRGYGVVRFDGKTHLAHRVAWLVTHGGWPAADLVIDHVCNNKACVNPEHLRELPNWQNLRRAVPRGDLATERRRARQRIADAKRRGNYRYTPGGAQDALV